jgi:hypothetical protein
MDEAILRQRIRNIYLANALNGSALVGGKRKHKKNEGSSFFSVLQDINKYVKGNKLVSRGLNAVGSVVPEGYKQGVQKFENIAKDLGYGLVKHRKPRPKLTPSKKAALNAGREKYLKFKRDYKSAVGRKVSAAEFKSAWAACKMAK